MNMPRLLLAACLLVLEPFASAAAPLPAAAAQAKVQVAFTPENEALLLECLAKASKQVRVAIYTMTRKGIADILIAKAARGVDVRVKVDAAQAKNSDLIAELLRQLRAARVGVEEIAMPDARYGAHMHHKFAVVDSRWVVTGSANWTKAATSVNWENTLLIDSPEIARLFLLEWERIGGRSQ